MRKLALLIVGVVAATVTAVVFAASGGAQQPGERTIVLVQREGKVNLVDNPPKAKTGAGISAGDIFVFASKSFSQENNARVGTSHGVCVATLGGKDFAQASFYCTGTFVLKDGDIAWAWAGKQGRVATLAITGGTGAYEGASGTVKNEDRSDNTSLETIHLLP